jgi:hypothetical protein
MRHRDSDEMDFSIRKTFDLTERFKFQIGFNAYNVLNHLQQHQRV